MDAFVLVEREDDLAVAARLEVVSSGILFTDLAVVVCLLYTSPSPRDA